MMLSVFSAEILLEIIQCLPFATIASLSTLSKSWAVFMAANESSASRSGTGMPQRAIHIPLHLQKVGKPGVSNPSKIHRWWSDDDEVLQSSINSRQNSGGLENFLDYPTESDFPKKTGISTVSRLTKRLAT
jgi:hypothetical protein